MKTWECCGSEVGSNTTRNGSAADRHARSQMWKSPHWRCGPYMRNFRSGKKSAIGFGIFLIVIGILALGSEAGLFQAELFWPIVLTIGGSWMLARRIVCGIPMLVMGVLLFAKIYGWVQPAHFLPMVLIACGLWFTVFSRVRLRRKTQ